MRQKFIKRLIFNTNLKVLENVRFLPKKKNTDTEALRLVYNKFKIYLNYANKTR